MRKVFGKQTSSIKIATIYLVRDIKPPKHQTTNLVLPNFPPRFSVLAVEKEKKLFIGPKQVFCQFSTNKKFISFYNFSTEINSWKKLGKTRLVV